MATQARSNVRKSVTGGIVLILIGALTLVGQLDILGNAWRYILPGLGLVFLAWGVLAKQFGLVIPGGILSGIGAGVMLIEGPYAHLGEPAIGGVFMLAFGAGWLLVALLSVPASGSFIWWPLIPGGVLAMFGGLLLAGQAGEQIMRVIGYAWPAALMAAGAWLLMRRSQ